MYIGPDDQPTLFKPLAELEPAPNGKPRTLKNFDFLTPDENLFPMWSKVRR